MTLPNRSRCAALWLAAALLGDSVAIRAQSPDPAPELEEAKTLYREAKFAEAIARLQVAIDRLEGLSESAGRRSQLAEALLHQALSYVALGETGAAKERLVALVRLDPERRLDPKVYAPKVLRLFETAREEVAAEAPPSAETPAASTETPAPAVPPPAVERKGGSAVPLVVLGAAGAAAVIAARAGGSSSTTPVFNDIHLVSIEPPAGSLVSLSRTRVLLHLRVSKAGPERGLIYAELRGECAFGGTESPSFEPGSDVQVRFPLAFRSSIRGTECERLRLPLRLPLLRATLLNERDRGARGTAGLATRIFTVNYTLVE